MFDRKKNKFNGEQNEFSIQAFFFPRSRELSAASGVFPGGKDHGMPVVSTT